MGAAIPRTGDETVSHFPCTSYFRVTIARWVRCLLLSDVLIISPPYSNILVPMEDKCPTCLTVVYVPSAEPLDRTVCPICGTEFIFREWFGTIRLLSVAGRGGMGMVYKAFDAHLHRNVALKVLYSEAFNKDEVSEIQREASIMGGINHPNVAKVFTTGMVQDQFYMAMELVEDGSLDDVIEARVKISESKLLTMAIEVASGLRAAWDAGVMHRDVKPANILFADNGIRLVAKIVDFGLATFRATAAKAATEIFGTPYYVSPEQLRGQPEDCRSDMYALGASLYHALAGQPPFDGELPQEVADLRLKKPAENLLSIAPSVSGPTAAVVNRMLMKSPSARFQTYDELIQRLEQAKEALPKRVGR